MRKLNQTLAVVLLLFVGLQSCNSSDKGGKESRDQQTVKDETLSGFMLGGVYFINGYGGISNVEKMMSDAGYTSDAELIGGYKQVFEFPFETSQASGIKSMFKNLWEINNKEDLLETISELKTKEGEHKAWDYARIVNNSAMGFACGWLTKDEVLKLNSEVLPIARKQYKDWKLYYADFIKGRDAWDPNDQDKEAFDAIIKDLTKNKKSIYNIIPLN